MRGRLVYSDEKILHFIA